MEDLGFETYAAMIVQEVMRIIREEALSKAVSRPGTESEQEEWQELLRQTEGTVPIVFDHYLKEAASGRDRIMRLIQAELPNLEHTESWNRMQFAVGMRAWETVSGDPRFMEWNTSLKREEVVRFYALKLMSRMIREVLGLCGYQGPLRAYPASFAKIGGGFLDEVF